jgi:hypothetical protein
MEVIVDRYGRRVFINSPYIQDAELKRNVLLYDPNGYNLNTSLYDKQVPGCQRWVDHFYQSQLAYARPPIEECLANERNFMNYK